MELIIGRDEKTRQLCITPSQQGARPKLFGAPGSVPDSVSRKHLKLTEDSERPGSYVVINLNPQNVTYVNGQMVEQMRVKEGDQIQMGPTQFTLDWNYVTQMVPVVVDLAPLEKVWTYYNSTRIKYQKQTALFNSLRSGLGIFTMAGVLLGVIGRDKFGGAYVAIYVVAISLSVIFFVYSMIMAVKTPKKNEQLNEWFQSHYLCPNPKCKRFLGNVPYKVLSQSKNCNYCRCTFRK